MRIIDPANVNVVAPTSKPVVPWLADKEELRLLHFYQTLTDDTDAFLAAGFTAEEIFWSRFYWFERLRLLHQKNGGFDTGIDQQAFQILENPFPPCEPDWANLESVKNQAQHDNF